MDLRPCRPLSRITLLLWCVAAAWLPSGFLFRNGIRDFGWGFLPFIAWMYSFPFIAFAAGIAFLRHRRGGGECARLRARVWLGFSIAYLCAAVIWNSNEALRDWVITGDWTTAERPGKSPER